MQLMFFDLYMWGMTSLQLQSLIENLYFSFNDGQIEANKRYTPILHHVHVPFVNHVITLFQSIQKRNHIMCCEHW